jgi:hypothetical protein
MKKPKVKVLFGITIGGFIIGAMVFVLFPSAPVDVLVSFAGFTKAPSPFIPKPSRYQFVNGSFFLSNAMKSATATLTFCDCQLKDAPHHDTMSLRDIGTVCTLRPGQSTNLVLPVLPSVSTHDITWRIRLTSSKRNLSGNLDFLPDWAQDVAWKVLPRRWLANEPEMVSGWVTNRAGDFSQFR